MKIRKIFIRVLLILLAVVTAGLLIRAIFNYRMGNKLEEYFSNRQAEGVALSRKALMPECSEAENGANLWKASEALFLREGINIDMLRNAMESFFCGKSLEQDIREELKKMIENNLRVFPLMEEASKKPCFRYGDWRKKIYNMRIPDAVKMISAVRLLGIDAVFQAEEGKIAEAIDQIRWGMRFVRKTMDESFLITGLIALANMKNLHFSLKQIICGRDIDSDTLRMLIQDLDPELWRKTFIKGIQGERVFFLENALDILDGNGNPLDFNLANNVSFWLIRPVTKADTLWALKMFDEVESVSRLPFYEIKEFQKSLSEDIDSIPWSFRISKHLFPNFSSAWLKEAILEAVMGTGQIALACKRATFQVTKLVMEKDDDWPWWEKIN